MLRARERGAAPAIAVAALILVVNLLSTAALADVSQSIVGPNGMLQSQWDQAVRRLDCAGALKSGSLETSGSGTEYKVKNLRDAIRCQSIPNQLTFCVMLATDAATYPDMKRTGQHLFAELETAIDNARGGDPHAFSRQGLSGSSSHAVYPIQPSAFTPFKK